MTITAYMLQISHIYPSINVSIAFFPLARETHGDTKFFCIRKAETPQSLHNTWWWAQSNTMSISVIQRCFHSDEKRGEPSPKRLRLHGLWVNAVTTSGSLCLIWLKGKELMNVCSIGMSEDKNLVCKFLFVWLRNWLYSMSLVAVLMSDYHVRVWFRKNIWPAANRWDQAKVVNSRLDYHHHKRIPRSGEFCLTINQ